MKLHQKGYLLLALSKVNHLWDYELIDEALNYYCDSSNFKEKSMRIALDELASAGLIKRINQKLSHETLFFRYQLSEFGRLRMIDTGLLSPTIKEKS